MVKKPAFLKKFTHDQQMGARRTLIEELFNDYYKERRNIYKVNFFRGVFFGLGSVVGGTIVVALLVWILGFFVDIPGIGNVIEKSQDQLQSAQ